MKLNLKLLLAVLALSFSTAFAQQDYSIHFRHGAVLPESNIRPSFIDSFNQQVFGLHQKGFAVLQFYNTPAETDKKKLSAYGVDLLHFISNSAYTVSISKALSIEVLSTTGVRAVFVLSPKYKMDAFLANEKIPLWAIKKNGSVDALLSFPKTFSVAEVLSELRKINVEVLSIDQQAYRIIAIRVQVPKLEELAALPFVEYVQVAPPADQILNGNSMAGSRANVLNLPLAEGGRGLNGEGVVAGVGDNADVQTHFDFAGRYINRSPTGAANHGHHVSGTLGGAGNIYEQYKGYAPKATILTQAFSGILRNAASYVQDYGMVITNNSYGNIIDCSYHGFYDLLSRALDQMAFDHPYLTNVFAAGNSGHITCSPFMPGFRTVLGSYQSAKNTIGVGATNDTGEVAFFSSRGPVMDGRLKPDITAMGQGVVSTWSNNNYSNNNGTSMAAPGVSGGLALLYQRYRQLHGGANPKNGLVKALLLNGATDKGNEGPDYKNGFGWMNLLRTVEMMEKNWFFTSSVAHAAQVNHTITVPPNTVQLKVMLYWNDPAGSMLSSKALVNDLDLQVLTPSSQTVLPRILDSSMLNVNNIAITGVDVLNNNEQVTINQPVAGTYTIRINGTAINENPSQEYFIAYDLVPVQLALTNPTQGSKLLPSGVTKINWEANGLNAGLADIELSTDDGATWSPIVAGIDVNRGFYSWTTPAITSDKARVRITKQGTGETSVSGPFIIIGMPALTLDAVQCEGYIKLNWTAVAGATDYEVMQLVGDDMKTIFTTALNSYTFSGLSKDSNYLVTVRPRINGKPGLRGPAIIRKPDNGSCAGNISDNDLKIDAVVAPYSGRLQTSTAPGGASVVSVRIKNLDDVAVNNFSVSYSINGGIWQTENNTAVLAGSALYLHDFSTTADLSAPGNYLLRVAVNNQAGDPVSKNDTLSVLVRTLANDPINLSTPFTDDMETANSLVYMKDTVGLFGLERYDYTKSAAIGRLRTFVNTGIAHSGSKALTLDSERNLSSGNTNYLTGTFHLGNYQVGTHDLRLDFRFLNHGQKDHAQNRVWIRGSDMDPWIEVLDLFAQQNSPGTYKKSESIELSNILAAASQQFSSSFQVRWGQHGTTSASDRWTGAGYSFDDVRIYQVTDDMQLRSIDAPTQTDCGMGSGSVVSVTVRNTSNVSLFNIPVRYKINNGNWISETIGSVPAQTNLQYHFTATADLSAFGVYTIVALVDLASDNFSDNDTLSVQVRNLSMITSYPYLQNFENGDGQWYTGGTRSSWQYGTIASYKMKSAASGSKAWKTSLNTVHNASEQSFLYSPCFNTTGMAAPTLSFSVSLDIEDCGNTICDAAWVEYSADGITWNKLGASGSGTNWYNKATAQVWSQENFVRWHVATIPLPVGLTKMRLRIVFKSDEGLDREGIAIDDIHIYDNVHGIYDGLTMTTPISSNVSGNNWVDFTEGGKLVASIHPKNQNLGTTSVSAFIFQGAVRYTSDQYYHHRNLTIQPAQKNPADSVKIRFYFLDAETDTLVKATGCNGCLKTESAYKLGVSKYSDQDLTFENGTISDNQQGLWAFIQNKDLVIVPFDKGYYAEFSVNSFSEFWLSNGGFSTMSTLPVKLMTFTATKNGADVLLQWKVVAEDNVSRYELELARGNDNMLSGNFTKIGTVNSTGNSISEKQYTFLDQQPDKQGDLFYRMRIVNEDGSFSFSPVRKISFDEARLWQVYPNPSAGLFNLYYQANVGAQVMVSLYDVKGRLVKQEVKSGNGLPQKIEIDLSSAAFANGIYLLQVTTGGKTNSFKLYKQ